MLRGLPLGRGFVLVVACLTVWALAAQAANTSRPTGRGAIHDNSVYCQNSPGQPARPAYRGTGSQNPFGGECGPGPQQQPQEQAEEDDSCPVSEASARPPGIVLIAAAAAEEIDNADYRSGLWIAAGQGRWKEVRNAGDVGLSGLSQLGQKIFEAMRCHRTRMFRFTDPERLKGTIELRVQIVKRMEARVSGVPRVGFSGCMALPSQWQKYPEPRGTLREAAHPHGYAARGKPGVKAHDAVQSFRDQNSELDCHAGAELTVLDAADDVLGPDRFNALHPIRTWPNLPPQDDGRPSEHALVGLGVPLLRDAEMNEVGFWFGSHVVELGDYTSLAKHLFVVRYHLPTGFRNRGSRDPDNSAFAGEIKATDMVPGDWAFIANVPDYASVAPGGANTGENLFYIGELTPGSARSRVFFGVGLEQLSDPPRFLTETRIRDHLREAFNDAAQGDPFWAESRDMVWTRLGGPTIDGKYPMEAGPFAPVRN